MNYVRTRAVFQERGKVVGATKTVSEARIAIMGNENAHTHKKEKKKKKMRNKADHSHWLQRGSAELQPKDPSAPLPQLSVKMGYPLVLGD